MPLVRVENFSVSIDGFGAGPGQSLENPLGAGGMRLHEWLFRTRTFQAMVGNEGGETGADDDLAAQGFRNVGAWILGRNMFGPVRGPWDGSDWKGWWGDDPPYHTPVFILTRFPRASIVMDGGTTFHFVTDGIFSALEKARAAAGEKDVRIGGGASTIRQYLKAGLIDRMHIAIAPVLLGTGERLFSDLDLPDLGYACTAQIVSVSAAHAIIERKN